MTITRPTRITHQTATLIDNIFVSGKLYRNFESAIILSDISDHLPILSLLKQSKYSTKQALEFTSRRLNRNSLAKIKHSLLHIDWIGLLNKKTSNENFDIFCNKVKEVMGSVSPEVNIRISYKCRYVEPWMSRGIELSSKKNLELYKKSVKKDATCHNIESYKIYRNEYNKLKRHAQKTYYQDKLNDCKNSMKDLWKVINRVIGKTKNKGNVISCITIDGLKNYNPIKMADEFGKFYFGLGEDLAKNIKQGPMSIKDYLKQIPRNSASLVLKPITLPEIE